MKSSWQFHSSDLHSWEVKTRDLQTPHLLTSSAHDTSIIRAEDELFSFCRSNDQKWCFKSDEQCHVSWAASQIPQVPLQPTAVFLLSYCFFFYRTHKSLLTFFFRAHPPSTFPLCADGSCSLFEWSAWKRCSKDKIKFTQTCLLEQVLSWSGESFC